MKARLILATVVGISVGFWVAARAVRAYPSDPSPMEGVTGQNALVDEWLDDIARKIIIGSSLSAEEARAVERGWIRGYTIR